MSSLRKRVAELLGNCRPPKRRSTRGEEASPSGSSESEDAWFDAASAALEPAASAAPPPLPPVDPGTRVEQLVHAVHADIGTRPYMEDAHAAARLSHDARAYAVFDGHGGAHVSAHCARHLLPRAREALAAALARRAAAAPAPAAPAPASGAPPEGAAIAAALRSAFAGVDGELARKKEAHVCGTTAAVAVVTDDWIYTANCGDSRVVLIRTNRALPLTVDHAPTRHDERERVRRAGGKVVWQNGLRVMGALSMTRAIGDHFLRRHGVIADPEIAAVRRSGADELLIIATDGLWNFVSVEEAAAVARRALARAAALPRRAAALVVPRALTKLALARGGSDNVCVVAVDLRPPGPGEDAAGGDAEAALGALLSAGEGAAAAAPAGAPAAPAPAAPRAWSGGGAAASPFQAASFELPAVNLPRIRTRPGAAFDDASAGAASMLLPVPLLGAAAAMGRSASDSLARERVASPLAMLRAQSAPALRLNFGQTVTTAGPSDGPAAAPAAGPAARAPSAAAAPGEAPPCGCLTAVCRGGCGAQACALAARASLPSPGLQGFAPPVAVADA
ncbi:hypothetical protein Rsub_01196 [Raphidocelis subcapitata]|uniref:PPM-type phosphatase domain-containing protein n=1 Tax=Raphidocelis subcapitata TaxID=307507 RepID=A0A2V0NSH4_9CHLO|nr:hypothetical protein Rsub_01196 [Raphidocelis subcapitata]|eukprot:GBF88483.1 hypothetical protein Rsub_01196 [Raphidocelis subcapitata]